MRQRPSGRLLPPVAVSNLAIRDFYTTLNNDGTFDGRMEELLCTVEGEAAQLLKILLSPFRRPGQLTEAEQRILCQFLSFQMVRGPRKRREIELEADYAAKLQAGGQLTAQDLREITAVVHPNEHIRLMGPTAYKIFECLMPRPVQVVRIDAPLFVTCDEPVLVDNDDHVQHRPECFLTREQVRRRRRRAAAAGVKYEEIVHIWPTRPSGVAVADAIVMPLTPSALLVLGRVGEVPVPEVLFEGDEARGLAEDVNAALVARPTNGLPPGLITRRSSIGRSHRQGRS